MIHDFGYKQSLCLGGQTSPLLWDTFYIEGLTVFAEAASTDSYCFICVRGEASPICLFTGTNSSFYYLAFHFLRFLPVALAFLCCSGFFFSSNIIVIIMIMTTKMMLRMIVMITSDCNDGSNNGNNNSNDGNIGS